ncbi:MAG: glycosyltransferase [Bacteroidia bacterium]|nr:glycosyltransferase [Bacteroidia bacterium]
MPSFLGKYKSAAADRDKKLVRAINSVLQQSFTDFELLVISDGCEETIEIVKKNFTDKRVRLFAMDKAPIFSGKPRNAGIYNAKGDWITYLDIDDMFGVDHLKILNSQITHHDWYWFDDRSYNVNKKRFGFTEKPELNDFNIHRVNIDKLGQCGTSNIMHRKYIDAYWPPEGSYKQDYLFIMTLKAISREYTYLMEVPQYLICHVPSLLDI